MSCISRLINHVFFWFILFDNLFIKKVYKMQFTVSIFLLQYFDSINLKVYVTNEISPIILKFETFIMNIDHILIFNINSVNPFNFKSQSLNSSTKQWVLQLLGFDALYKLHCQFNLSSQHYLSINWILADETSKGSSVLLYFYRVIVEIQSLLIFVGKSS